ncbi:MAG: polysaccharide deacetylase family protein [Mesorhizobium sp.]
MADTIWTPLIEALESGIRPQFWLRDDDAVEPTPALDRLVATCEQADIPLVLAVIPRPTGEALAARLANAKLVSVAVHGWAHQNHASSTEKKQEFGPHRPLDEMLNELRTGREKLEVLHGERFIPMLVPPWNRIDPRLPPLLPSIGFEALSTFGPAAPGPIQIINSNVDLIDWHGTRGCVDHAVLVSQIVERLAQREPVGILGHHLVHDEAVWAFLEKLFAVTRTFNIEWLSGAGLVRGSA